MILREKPNNPLLHIFGVGVTAIVIVGLLVPSTTIYTSESARVHQNLDYFRRRGQLFIETFPPLSYYFTTGPVSELNLLKWLIVGSNVIFAWGLLVLSGQTRRLGALRSLITILLFNGVYTWCWKTHFFIGKVNAVAGSRAIGESLGLFTLLLARCSTGPLLLLRHAGILEIFAMISICLGSRVSDGTFCLVEISIYRLYGTWAALADKRKCAWTTICVMVGRVVQQLLVLAATLTCIFAITFPLSETSMGGNYNLRYLPAHYRRDLRPQIGAYDKGVDAIAGRSFPAFALVPDAPISLYIPQAGFIWTDDLTWDINSGKFEWEEDLSVVSVDIDEKGVDHLVDRQPRIIFSDQFNTVGPWYFEQLWNGASNQTDEVLTSRIWPGQSVYLRNYQNGEYVTASMDGATITDMYNEIPDDDIRRLHVSAAAEASNSSSWKIIYDAHQDEGFRLWNTEANCFLATSYRTYPNMHGHSSNDTIRQALDLELEACCTYPPSRLASTFYAIDGVQKPLLPSTWLSYSFGTLALYEIRLRGHWKYTRGLLHAMFDLYHFRQKHASLQDMTVEHVELHSGVPYPTGWSRAFLAVMICSVFLHVGQVMYAQRTQNLMPGRDNQRAIKTSYGDLASWVQVCYIVLGIAQLTLSQKQVCDSHFMLGVAWISIMDGIGIIVERRQKYTDTVLTREQRGEKKD